MQRHYYCRLFLLTMLMSIVGVKAFADTFTVDGIKYETTGEATVMVIKKTQNYGGDVTIPASVNDGTKDYSVTTIADEAFLGWRINTLTIPKSITSLYWKSFEYCEINSIVVEEGNSVYDSRGGCNAIIETSTNTLIIGSNNTVIPNTVTSIGEKAFEYSFGLTSINIPSSVTTIGYCVFNYCHGLTSITVEEGNTKYDSRDGCNALIETSTNTLIRGTVNTIIPYGITKIGDAAFNDLGFSSISIPSSVTTIGYNAFEYCTNLTSIYCYAPSAVADESGYEIFEPSGVDTNPKLYVLSDRLDYYKDFWSSYADRIEAIPDPAALTTTSAEEAEWSSYYNGNANVHVDANTTVYKVTLDGDALTLTDTGSKIIKAGEAVVLSSTASGISLTYTSTESTGDYTSNSLLGSNAEVTQESGYTYYALANLTNGLGFYKLGSGVNIPANKAYIKVASVSGAHSFYGLLDEDNTTGINSISVLKENKDYYDFTGRRVSQPTKGLYIVNGKKVIIK